MFFLQLLDFEWFFLFCTVVLFWHLLNSKLTFPFFTVGSFLQLLFFTVVSVLRLLNLKKLFFSLPLCRVQVQDPGFLVGLGRRSLPTPANKCQLIRNKHNKHNKYNRHNTNNNHKKKDQGRRSLQRTTGQQEQEHYEEKHKQPKQQKKEINIKGKIVKWTKRPKQVSCSWPDCHLPL